MRLALLLPALLSTSSLAELTQIQIHQRQAFAEGHSFSSVGSYEVISGILHFELDPAHPGNQRVHDLAAAAKNENGKVAFTTDFYLICPVQPEKGNGRLLYDVHNRGNKLALWTFNNAPRSNSPLSLEEAGSGFLMSHGYSLLWTGWNAEVVEDGNQRLTMQAPIALDSNGQPIQGPVHLEICVTEAIHSRSFAWSPWGVPAIFPAASLDHQSATLSKRRYRHESPELIPHDQWSFAREENGSLIPDPTHIHLKPGFEPGLLYDLVYTATHPRVAGTGIAALRDTISFLKHAENDSKGTANPLAGSLQQAILFGISQSGRLGNFFIHEGFNADLEDRIVFDSALLHVAGAGKGLFTSRFRNATDAANHHEANWSGTEYFPFSPTTQTDPVTGISASLLDRARATNTLPNIFYTQSSTEYWARAASLLHTDPNGQQDLELPPEVRVYLTAGSQHLGATAADPGTCQQPKNTLDDRGPILRALLLALDAWTSHGTEPPASRYPSIVAGTLIPVETFASLFPKIPGIHVPGGCYTPHRLDFGPRLENEGIADIIPPQVGPAYRTLVPAVNADGNEIDGIILPDIAVPISTHTGWNLRAAAFGPADRLSPFDGMEIPFARTADERAAANDPRPSIAERYPTKQDYLGGLTEAAIALKNEGFLLDEDFRAILEKAATRDLW